jgi:serine/threonine protein kinase
MHLARSLSEAGSERVAEILAIGSLNQIQDRPFSYSIQPRLDAPPLSDITDPNLRQNVLKQVAEVVTPLHQIQDNAPVFPKDESLQRLHDTVSNALKSEHGERLIEAGIITEVQWTALTERFNNFEWNHEIEPCVVHDDLNPNNILYNQETGTVFVIDWELPTADESRYKDNAGFASLGRFREMVSFTPILATDAEQAAFVEGLGMDPEAFLSSPIKQDLDTIQLAMTTSVAGYFIDAAKKGNAGAQQNLEGIRNYLQDRLVTT